MFMVIGVKLELQTFPSGTKVLPLHHTRLQEGLINLDWTLILSFLCMGWGKACQNIYLNCF